VRTAWLYGPTAAGASGLVTTWRLLGIPARLHRSGRGSATVARHAPVPGSPRRGAGRTALLAAPAPAGAAVAWSPAPNRVFRCSSAGASASAGPDDRHARRRRPVRPPAARAEQSGSSAVVALAGGPGQAAAPLARGFAQRWRPACRTATCSSSTSAAPASPARSVARR
jgi:hypothetical protein